MKASNSAAVSRAIRLACAFALAALCGCHTTYFFGDARIQRNPDLSSVSPDRFYLPPVPLGAAGTHVFAVRNLAFALYPTHLTVPITPAEAELEADFPWADSRMRIEFRDLEGETFFSREVALAEAARGRSAGTHHQIELAFRHNEGRPWAAPTNMPPHTSYDVIVTVLEPSRNPNHRAELHTTTYVR